MLSDEVISELKKKYGKIYSASNRGQDYVFRILTFAELDALAAHNDWSSAEGEDAIVRLGVIYPEDFDPDRLKAGFISQIAQDIINFSGFGEAKYAIDTVNAAKSAAGELRGLMKAFVLAGLSGYTDEDLDRLTFPELADKAALAEKVIEILQGIQAGAKMELELIDPEEENEKKERLTQKHAATKERGQAGMNDPIAQKLHGMAP